MKNTTRRPPLIIHSAPKQSQRGHLETKVEADSPFTASQHPTLLHPWAHAGSNLNSKVLAQAGSLHLHYRRLSDGLINNNLQHSK